MLPPAISATTSMENLVEAMTRGRGIAPKEEVFGGKKLQWGRANAWESEAERAESEKRTRALRAYLAPAGSFQEDRVRSAAPMVDRSFEASAMMTKIRWSRECWDEIVRPVRSNLLFTRLQFSLIKHSQTAPIQPAGERRRPGRATAFWCRRPTAANSGWSSD